MAFTQFREIEDLAQANKMPAIVEATRHARDKDNATIIADMNTAKNIATAVKTAMDRIITLANAAISEAGG